MWAIFNRLRKSPQNLQENKVDKIESFYICPHKNEICEMGLRVRRN